MDLVSRDHHVGMSRKIHERMGAQLNDQMRLTGNHPVPGSNPRVPSDAPPLQRVPRNKTSNSLLWWDYPEVGFRRAPYRTDC